MPRRDVNFRRGGLIRKNKSVKPIGGSGWLTKKFAPNTLKDPEQRRDEERERRRQENPDKYAHEGVEGRGVEEKFKQVTHTGVTFDDVAGVDEAKAEVQEIVDFLKNPEKFTRLGAKIPKGALLIGPPGTGKTLLAQAVAGEAGVPFFEISGSKFMSSLVGSSKENVIRFFEQAKQNTPCILFIDEIDAIGAKRGRINGSEEREHALNEMLVAMNGFDKNSGIIVLAATNRPDVLDDALVRPGRLDRQVVVGLADRKGREQILEVHTGKRNMPLADDVDIGFVARSTPGFSGAQLEQVVNEAAIFAARADRDAVEAQDFLESVDKIMMGAARTSLVMTPNQKEHTAYHEAGHAIVGLRVPGNDPLHKVTIVPRGRALGVTMNVSEEDKWSQTKSEMRAKLAMLFGGRVAEEMIYGEDNVSNGAENDIQKATDMAYNMVAKWGMSEELGRVRYAPNGQGIAAHEGHGGGMRPLSPEISAKIDEEIKILIDEAEMMARAVLEEHSDDLELLKDGLMEHETLTGAEVDRLLSGQPVKQYQSSNDNESRQRPEPPRLEM